VQETPLAGAHGGECIGFTGGADAGDGGGRLLLELKVALGFEVVGVEGDVVVLVGGEAEELGAEMLEGEEEFAVTGGEERGVGAGEVEGERAGFCFRVGGDGEGEVEVCVADGGVEEVRNGLEGRVYRGHAGGHLRGFGRVSFCQRLRYFATCVKLRAPLEVRCPTV